MEKRQDTLWGLLNDRLAPDSERPHSKGVYQRVTEQDTQCAPLASLYVNTGMCFYTHVRDIPHINTYQI